jgi:Secretion system C-terminal sorting domain
MQFIVNNPNGIIVKQLGAFDDNGNGIAGLQPGGGVRVAIFNRSTHTIVPGLDVTIVGNADHYTGNHRMKDITPVILPPGDYVIVAKGYHAGERNGNSFNGGGPYPVGDNGGGSISFGNETSYGPDDANGFNYPATAGNFGNSPVFLAGTFSFTVTVNCPPLTTRTSVTTKTTIPAKQPVKEPKQELMVMTKEMKIYPNPTNGQFTVQLNGVNADKVNIQVMNSYGRMVEQKTVGVVFKTGSMLVPFNLANQPAGIYLVKVESADGIQTAKIVIQR